MNRMALAKWWGALPFQLAGGTMYDLQAMSEFRDRIVEAEADAIERAKYGLPVDQDARRYKGRRGPQKGDMIVKGGKDDGW